MGYVFMTGLCITCGKMMSFNPHKVPSLRVKGEREPVCIDCVNQINTNRQAEGKLPNPIPKDAYEPMLEEEL